jgi:hypothetical protein
MPRKHYVPISVAIAENVLKPCEEPSCPRGRYKLGRYCRPHAYKYLESGHPTAGSLGIRTWRPYFERASAFVTEQLRARHAGIADAIRWVSSEIDQAKNPTIHKGVHLKYSDHLLQCVRHAVEPVDFVSRWIAGELVDTRGLDHRPLIASDRHHAHQKAHLYLYRMPFGSLGNAWAPRKPEPQAPDRIPYRVRFSVRVFTHDRVNAALGRLAIKAANEIRRREAAEDNDAPADLSPMQR